MGSVADGFETFRNIQDSEMLVWGRLRALQMGASALSANDRPMVLQALQEAATLDFKARLTVRQNLPFAEKVGFKPDASTYRSAVSQVYVGGRFTPSICTSIDTPVDQANRAQVTPLPL